MTRVAGWIPAMAIGSILLAAARGAAYEDCTRTSYGYIPLTDLGTGTYSGFPGGLYPGGSNVRPPAHDAAGRAIAASITPLDASGKPDPANGRIGVLTFGMSNTFLESEWVVFYAQNDPLRNPAVELVDGALSGQSSQKFVSDWSFLIDVVTTRIANAGLTPDQIQVMWFNEADENVTTKFPVSAEALESENEKILNDLMATFPNLRLCFVSSRIYGGYGIDSASPEPYAYEAGFSYKWLIEAQIDGDPSLNFDPSRGPVTAPWLAWGPYLWADGTTPRSDGLTWVCGDFQLDGMHPSFTGSVKVATRVLQFLQTDPAATPWYLQAGGASATAAPAGAPLPEKPTLLELGLPRPNPFSVRLSVPVSLTQAEPVSAAVYTVAGRRVRDLAFGVLSPGRHELSWDGRDAAGRPAEAGVYLLQVDAGGTKSSTRATLVR